MDYLQVSALLTPSSHDSNDVDPPLFFIIVGMITHHLNHGKMGLIERLQLYALEEDDCGSDEDDAYYWEYGYRRPSLDLGRGDKIYGKECGGEWNEYLVGVRLNGLGRRLFKSVQTLAKIGLIEIKQDMTEFIDIAHGTTGRSNSYSRRWEDPRGPIYLVCGTGKQLINTQEDEDRRYLTKAKEYSEKLSASLPKSIKIASLTLKSKLPFKALSIREALLYRMEALSKSAVDLFQKKQAIPAVVLTRAILETVAVMFTFHQRLDQFLKEKNKNIKALDDFLMRCIFGTNNDPNLPPPINVLTFIDKVEKEIPSFRNVYENLSEFAHPNWAGTSGSFGKIDKENFELKLGPVDQSPAYSTGLIALITSLEMFENFYNDSGDLVQKFNDHFERFA